MTPSNNREFELILLGATGYTGKLVAEWISAHLPRDLKWAIAGRNAKKLQTAADELKLLSPNRPEPALETCELKPDQLAALVQRTRLLITTIGPFMHYGEPALAACAAHGTHYLDCTGEVPWYYDMVAKYDEQARNTGAIIIPECGLDSVPADMMAFIVSSYIRKTFDAPTESVTMTLYDCKTGISGGTSHTMLDMFEKYPLKHMGESLKPYSLSPTRPTQPSKPLEGTSTLHRLFGLLKIPELGGVQTVGLMASVDTCIAHRSWGLYQAASKATSKPFLAYGSKFRFVEHMRAKNIFAGLFFKFGLGFMAMLLAIPVTRWIFSPLIKKFLIPQPGEGPSKEQMKEDYMCYKGLGIADSEKKEKVLGTIDTPHGGYGITGLTLSAAAKVILRGRLEETEAGRLGGGIVTPATLGEQFVGTLREFGMKIDVQKL